MPRSDDFYRGLIAAAVSFYNDDANDLPILATTAADVVRVAAADRNIHALAALSELGVRGAKVALRAATTTPKRRRDDGDPAQLGESPDIGHDLPNPFVAPGLGVGDE